MTNNQYNELDTPRSYFLEAILFITYAFFAVNWIAGSNLTPQIMEHFGITEFASATFISNAVTIAKIIGNFVAASILNKLYPKKSIGLGALLIFLGCVVAILAPAYSVFIIGRFIMGFGGALYVVYFSPVVINYFSPAKRPTVNALNSVCYNVGSVMALVLITPVVQWLNSWQYSMGFFAAISGVLFILWLIFGEDFDINKGRNMENNVNYTMGDALKERFNWIFSLAYSGLLTFYIVLLNMFPLTNTAVIDGKTLSTLTAIGGIVGTIIAIFLARVYFKRRPVMIISGGLMTLAGILMLKTDSATIAMICAFLIGLFMFLPMTSLVTIPQELPGMTASKLTVVMGMFWAVAYAVQFVVYYILGKIVDAQGSYDMAIWISVIFSLTFVVGGFLLPETGKDKESAK